MQTAQGLDEFPDASVSRRSLLRSVGMGFPWLALTAVLNRDRSVRGASPSDGAPPSGQPHFAPRAKNVIWLFLPGGYSQMETFDPKPALNQFAGKTYSDTPFQDPVKSPHLKRLRSLTGDRRVHPKLLPLQIGFHKHGESGIEISDWWPRLATCVDDVAFVRSMYTTDNEHTAMAQMHSGRHKLDETQPSVGAWVHYGLGSLNENLPHFIAMGDDPGHDPQNKQCFQAYYLGPEHAAVHLPIESGNPLPFGTPGPGILPGEQRNKYALIDRLNKLAALESPDDLELKARIRSYELAFRMQMSVPSTLDLKTETPATHKLYGLDNNTTRTAAQFCLTARRMVEQGVRFVHIYLYGKWDAHDQLKKVHATDCAQVDQPIAALLTDLKQRGMLDETLVVCCTEFGRSPGGQNSGGRDHHPFGFSVWLAGGGIKGGTVHGATDELGFHAVEDPHYVTDLHATVLRQLGLDPHELELPGRKRLEVDFGHPIRAIIS